jgi:hypothetical protein
LARQRGRSWLDVAARRSLALRNFDNRRRGAAAASSVPLVNAAGVAYLFRNHLRKQSTISPALASLDVPVWIIAIDLLLLAGDSKNRSLDGLTRPANQILPTVRSTLAGSWSLPRTSPELEPCVVDRFRALVVMHFEMVSRVRS